MVEQHEIKIYKIHQFQFTRHYSVEVYRFWHICVIAHEQQENPPTMAA